MANKLYTIERKQSDLHKIAQKIVDGMQLDFAGKPHPHNDDKDAAEDLHGLCLADQRDYKVKHHRNDGDVNDIHDPDGSDLAETLP